MTNISIRYQIEHKVRSWRLKRKYTLKDLAGKVNINYHTLLRYEQGACGIPIGKLKILADALSVPIRNLFPKRKVLKESSCFDKAIVFSKMNDKLPLWYYQPKVVSLYIYTSEV
ncbi:helix-turn-helix domain-containing protein [Wolbachia endosymbiont of Tetranychus urticae]|uniref:helix-turn-helix domain-containing protein n=1 Tax=Wolbachia endosymbiont of Tetranychus urticae TaxID=169184 RepID=UPI00397CF4E9